MRQTLPGGMVCLLTALVMVAVFSTSIMAHPGSGIVVDRQGEIYFVDTGSGVWKIDTHGTLIQIPGPRFHWMTMDADERLRDVRLPSGSDWEITRVNAKPTLMLASDFPIAMGRDGSLYYPSHGGVVPLEILQLMPSGRTSVLARLPATTAERPLRGLNGLATGPDGSIYYTENNAIRRITPQGQPSKCAR